MKQCLKLSILGKIEDESFRKSIQKYAQELHIEGTIQLSESGSLVIFACGLSENLDLLVDHLYKGCKKASVEDVSAEPLVSEKDFRGVFRIIG